MRDDGPAPPTTDGRLLGAMANLARAHRAHEEFYASAPRENALRLQRHARTLLALADRWTTVEPSTREPFSPFEGAEDLNASAATQLDGVLFMEGGEEPAEIGAIKRELRAMAADAAGTGEWLATAMDASWSFAATLLEIDELADQIGERHRIIADDLQAAAMSSIVARLLDRGTDVLETIDFSPPALRADLAGPRIAGARLYAAAELIGHAADLFSDSAGLVHANERRWRVFRSRVLPLLADREGPGDAGREPTPGE